MIQMAIRSIMGKMVIFNAENIDKIKVLMEEGAFVDSDGDFVEDNDPDDDTESDGRVLVNKRTLN